MGRSNEEMATVLGRDNLLTKTERYGWKTKDKPGKFLSIHKANLYIEGDYQRTSSNIRVKVLAANWSWVACGCIIVGSRDGLYWVIDGQNRVIAAQRREDIGYLPCLVFETETIAQEARGFRDINIRRKNVTSVENFKAAIVGGDELALYVHEVLTRTGFEVTSKTEKPRTIKSISCLLRMANENKEVFLSVICTIDRLCAEEPVKQILLEGLSYIHKYCNKSLNDMYMRDRLMKVGSIKLIRGAKNASGLYGRGGAKVYAEGMMIEINKGIRNKMYLKF